MPSPLHTEPSTRHRAVSLYRAVRDQLRYDPYRIDLSAQGMRASTALQQGHGWCVLLIHQYNWGMRLKTWTTWR